MGKIIQKEKYSLRISWVLLVVSALCLILVMTALQDIFHNKESVEAIQNEWEMVRLGFIIFWIFHFWIALNLLKNKDD